MLKKALIKLICTFGLVLLVSSCGNIMSRNLNSDDVGNNQNENTNNNNSESSDFEKYFHFTSELEEGLLFTLTDASEYPVGNECTPDFEFDGFIDYYMKLIRQEGLLSGQLMFKGDSTCFILMNFNTEQLFELVYAEEGSEMSGYLYNEEEETFTVLYDPKVPPVFRDLEVTTGAEYISLEQPYFYVGNPSTVFAYIGLEGTISINGSSVIGYFDFADMNEQGYQFSGLTPETAYRIIVVAENDEGYTVSETVQTTATCTFLAIPDAGLLSAIRTTISKPTGDICREDLAALKTFSAPSSNISDVTGLEYFISLERLDLRDNQIVDISSLSGLTGLRDLYLCGNQIIDISDLSELTNLRQLNLSSNQIVDISSLSGLTSLYYLELSNNQIVDISNLSGLTSLRDLRLMGNQIVNISSLSGLTGLSGLDLRSNQIVDISILSGLTNLTQLQLYSNQIVDISSLSGLTSLSYLELSNNQIVSITPLMTNFWAGGLVGASVSLSTNNLDAQALSDAQTLLDNGVNISW